MKKSSRVRYLLAICLFMIPGYPMDVQAKGMQHLPPHLIQSVGDREIYEGMAALGMLQCPALEESNCGLAYENVKNCVVRVQMGNAHGSGILWKLEPDMVVVATNRHVLEYWDDADSYVYFPQGYYMDARILGVSEQYDVGFLAVDAVQFTYEELMGLRCVRVEEKLYSRMLRGDVMFFVDLGAEAGEGRFYEAVLEDLDKYIADFDANMLYGRGFAREGMSGGGTFDGRGYLIGMITGGTIDHETASVPLPDLIAAYGEIMQINGEQ